jgi:hypothetical protein
VQRKWATLLSDTGVDEIKMKWSDLNTGLLKVWTATFRELVLLDEFGIGSGELSGVAANKTAPVQQIPHQPAPQTVASAAQGQSDIVIQCCVCTKAFGFSLQQQEKFKLLGFSDPKRCPDCRNTQNKKCDQFNTNGSCSFGDNCKYSHESVVVLAVTDLSGSTGVSTVQKCTGCANHFDVVETEWTNKGLVPPKSCRDCRDKRNKSAWEKSRESSVLCTEFDMSDEDY